MHQAVLIYTHTNAYAHMSLRGRAEAYEVAMPLLGPPEKHQLNATCTLTLDAPVPKNHQPLPHPEQIR